MTVHTTNDQAKWSRELAESAVRFDDFGCYVALSSDRATIFSCPLLADGSPEKSAGGSNNLNWSEVTAPEPEFIERVNDVFGCLFDWGSFSGR